ncbi:MAG: radical SAM protein [Chloroflexota bacterium]
MQLVRSPDRTDKLERLVAGAQFDVASCTVAPPASRSPLRFIHRATVPGRGSTPLFKLLYTDICTNDCAYCANRVGRDWPRTSFTPDELASLFMELYDKRLVSGLFLSSGIGIDATRTMGEMVKTVDILRHRYDYQGYVHLKILPGASHDCVEAGSRLATRISVNMEAPTADHLARLSSKKHIFRDIVERMRWVKNLSAAHEGILPSGQTTQFVVGAAGETDANILTTVQGLYNEIGLRRVYFSAYRPAGDPRLANVRAAPAERAHRLYQVDWLLRVYGFSPTEIELALGRSGNLPVGKDPKLVIASKQPWLYPLDINTASYEELVRVPGVGPTSAHRICDSRKSHTIGSVRDLQRMGVAVRRALPYIRFGGMLGWEKQLSFLPQLEEEPARKAPALATALEGGPDT